MINNKSRLLLCLFIFCYSLILRYPTTPYPVGSDSYVYSALTSSMIENGNLRWFYTPISYFGLYPDSTPAGNMALYGSIAIITGLELNNVIFLLSSFIGTFAFMNMYLFTRELKFGNALFPFLVAITFSTSKMFLDFTTWTISTRALALSLIPLFLLFLLKIFSAGKFNYSFLFLSIFLAFSLITIHRLIFLVPLLVLSLFISFFIKKHSDNYQINERQKIVLVFCYLIIFFIALIYPYYFNFLYRGSNPGHFYTGWLTDGESLPVIILNMMYAYSFFVGLLLVFALPGLLSILLVKNKKHIEFFVLTAFLILSPFYMDSVYVSFFSLIILSFLIGYGLLSFINDFEFVKSFKSLRFPFIVLIVVFSNMLPYIVTVRETPVEDDHKEFIEYQTYNTGLYMGVFYSDKSLLIYYSNQAARIFSVSSSNLDNTLYNRDIKVSYYEFVELKDVTTGEYDHWVEKPYYERDIYWYLPYDAPINLIILPKYDILVEDKYHANSSAFQKSIHASSYKSYDDGLNTIYKIP